MKTALSLPNTPGTTARRKIPSAPKAWKNMWARKRPRRICGSSSRRPSSGESPWTMSSSMGRRGWERPPSPASSPPKWGWTCAPPPAPPSKSRGTWPPSSPIWRRGISSLLTRFTASTAAWRRFSIPLWRITPWISSWGKALPPAPFASTCPGSPWWEPPPGRDSSPVPCGTALGWFSAWSFTRRRNWPALSPAAPAFWASPATLPARASWPAVAGAPPASPTAF